MASRGLRTRGCVVSGWGWVCVLCAVIRGRFCRVSVVGVCLDLLRFAFKGRDEVGVWVGMGRDGRG